MIHALRVCYVSELSGDGAIAQLGEHLVCNQGVVGSIPTGSTNLEPASPVREAIPAACRARKRDDSSLPETVGSFDRAGLHASCVL